MVSRNYNVMARLGIHRFRAQVNEYPEYKKYLKKYVQGYNYRKKTFIMNVMKQIEFLENLTKEQQMTVLYSLKQKHYEKDMVILKQHEAIETIYIIMYG